MTPIYIPPPKPKITTPRPISKSSGNKPCSEDDEDCLDSGGSGFEEIAVPPRGATTKRPMSEIRRTDRPAPPKLVGDTATSVVIRPTLAIDVEPPSDEYFATDRSPGSEIGVIAPTDIFTNYRPSGGFNAYPPPIDHGVDRDYNEQGSRGGKKRRTKSRSAETLTLVVGVVASVMIAVVVIAFLVYRFKNKPEGTYKIDETKNYRYGSAPDVAPPLPRSASGYGSGCIGVVPGAHPVEYQPQINGGVRTFEKAGKLPKKKDIKEWYV